MGRKVRDLTDQRFGRLVAIRSVGRKYGGNVYWLCRCDCGNESEVKNSALLAPTGRNTWSCGCGSREKAAETGRETGGRNKTHGASHTPEHNTYVSMIRRCENPRSQGYELYGGRGITVCQRWRESFENFLADMGPRPEGDFSIDRIDNNGNYESSNCRWATWQEQCNNQRRTIVLEHDGRKMSLADWARELGISKKTLWFRLKRIGMTPADALTIRVNHNLSRAKHEPPTG